MKGFCSAASFDQEYPQLKIAILQLGNWSYDLKLAPYVHPDVQTSGGESQNEWCQDLRYFIPQLSPRFRLTFDSLRLRHEGLIRERHDHGSLSTSGVRNRGGSQCRPFR